MYQIIEIDFDKGNGTADMVTKRSEVVNSLQEIDKLQTMEIAQKAKIKWCIEGDENSNPLKVKREFYQHFSNRFAKPVDQRAHINMEYPNTMTSVQQIGLGCHFCGAIPNGCNSSFIALIPKIPDANLVKDFRPISLIGSMYKIIAKILANRLVGVLGDIVNEVQSAFIAERQILNGPFILNEVLQWCKLKKKQSFIFKVDFEKAFDSIRWDFLDDILKKLVLVINGATGFKVVLDRREVLLSSMVVPRKSSISKKRVVDVGMFKGVQLNPSLNLSHMFYADDAVFVGQWCDDNINILTHVLDCFYWASGLRINMSKSKIIGDKCLITHIFYL
ncbi:RNA-directed DNA polymerase, eukaryota [Tanacetum coccineum]